MHQETIIDIEHLRSQFGRTVIHDDLNLKVQRGEVFSIVGGSGSGKTVLMRQMLGLEIPKQGVIRVFGDNIHEPKEHLTLVFGQLEIVQIFYIIKTTSRLAMLSKLLKIFI